MATGLGEKKLRINPALKIDLESHPARVEGLGKYIQYNCLGRYYRSVANERASKEFPLIQ